jgi:hypothetical protein
MQPVMIKIVVSQTALLEFTLGGKMTSAHRAMEAPHR